MQQSAINSETSTRLSRISTQWSLVFDAHRHTVAPAEAARAKLVERYHGAAFRYLLGATRDADAAEELAQEFALRMMRGDFHRASADRGKFRNYLKTALSNLVNDYFKAKQNQPHTLDERAIGLQAESLDDDDTTKESDFVKMWRSEILDHTWCSLNSQHPAYYDVLRMKVEDPQRTSRNIAEKLSTAQKPVSPESVRKTLQRSHKKFAELLVEEVALTLERDAALTLHDELVALDLLKYCRSAYERWSKKTTKNQPKPN